MRAEEINEIIAVTTDYRLGRMVPVRFDWKNRIYTIDRIHSQWEEKGLGAVKEHHFTVSAGCADMYELIFEPAEMRWRIGQVLMEG